MNIDEIKEIQEECGAYPDGDWGPESKAECKEYLRSLMPDPNPWPAQRDRVEFYGRPGDNFTRINVEGLGVKYDGRECRQIMCHEKCAESLLAIITEISQDPEIAWVLGEYAGCFANKPLMHGHAAAIDLAPDGNGMDRVKCAWPTRATMPWKVVKIFSRYGWTSAAGFWNYDAMHFQASTP